MCKPFLLLLLPLLFAGTLAAQTTSLFSLNLTPVSGLNEAQTLRYNKLATNPEVVSIHFVTTQPLFSVEDDGNLLIDLPFLPCDAMILAAGDVRTTEEGYSWYGYAANSPLPETETCTDGSLLLNYADNEYRGYLQVGDNSYQFYDLTGGIQAMVEFALPQEPTETCGTPHEEEPFALNTTLGECDNNVIKIMVLYTADAAAKDPNIVGTINACIADMNTLINNSGVNPSAGVSLVHQQQINFTPDYNNNPLESPTGDINLIKAQYNSLRNAKKADIVVVLVGHVYSFTADGQIFPSVRGIAADYNFTQSKASAFAIVHVSDAVSGFYHTFAHETGHLFGGRHKGDTGGTVYDQGYQFGGGDKYSTIMVSGNDLDTKKGRIPYFSTPNRKYKSKKTGNPTDGNVARRMNETYATVAAHYADFAGPSVSITTALDECSTNATVTALPKCGTAPYTVVWKLSTNGKTWTGLGSPATSKSFALPLSGSPCAKTFFVSATVTDATGKVFSATHNLVYTCDDCSGGPLRPAALPAQAMARVAPVPAQDVLTVTLGLPEAAPVDLRLTDLAGKTVFEGHTPLNAGYSPLTLPVAALANGVYTLSITGPGLSYTQSVIVQH